MASASQQYYLMTNQSPSGTLLCEGDLTNNSWYSSDLPSDLQPGVHYKVYDTRMFDLVGSQICHDINEPAPVPTTYGQNYGGMKSANFNEQEPTDCTRP